MANYRIQRVNSEFQKAITEIIAERIKDPRLTDMVTVTKVDVDGDLRNGKVYISIYSQDPETKQGNFDAIRHSAGFIKHQLSQMIPHIRQIPNLTYIIDENLDYSDKINRLLAEIKSKDKK